MDMQEQRITLYEILVPTIMRGKPVRLRHHKEWDKFVRKITGGLTVLKPAKGQWINPETSELMCERVIPVRIACTREQLDKIIEFTITHYDQIAVMAYLVSTEVVIKRREERHKLAMQLRKLNRRYGKCPPRKSVKGVI